MPDRLLRVPVPAGLQAKQVPAVRLWAGGKAPDSRILSFITSKITSFDRELLSTKSMGIWQPLGFPVL